ncbi:hypothetical protein [Rhodohalobacter mucosus]|uniref:Uncharacterized protein n=1 Tax=Rhodohalobacter mucosus TaxID=2079485 RepID=A0A316TZ20_9BACT|nr:hypothetical protein [Rhodohalobacter mucosus]PWN05226.1 hypothetical protein DDZ15_15995 [Rhodohalobacter mucosus]
MTSVTSMKILALLATFFLLSVSAADAQLRKDLNPHTADSFGTSITHTSTPGSTGSWMNLLNMTMSHSYSMSFSNFGGQMQNLNAYTNSMYFDVSNKLDAQVDISVLHSPFGNSFMNNSSAMNTQIIVDRARIDYRLSDNARISLQFSQNPYYSPFSNYGYGNPFSPFNRSYPGY